MNPYRYSVSLRAMHPRDDLRPLFDQLGLVPRRAYRAGERKPFDPGPRQSPVYAQSYAYTNLTPESRNWSDEDLETFLRSSAWRSTATHCTRSSSAAAAAGCSSACPASTSSASSWTPRSAPAWLT